jgi:molybdopterin molybdotransferase
VSRTEIVPEPSCADDAEPALLPVDEALARIRAAIPTIAERERVALRDALGRVLAANAVSANDVPMHTNSAVDGYAFDAGALPDGGTATLRVVGTSWAGKPHHGALGPGECARIMTGATLPAGADTVEMQEAVEREGDRIRLPLPQKPGSNVRLAGEDLKAGAVALPAGRRVTPADLGVLASIGLGEVHVWRKPRVAFFSNGDELRSLGEPLHLGEVYDSNRYTLYGMLTRMMVDMVDLGVVADDPAAIREAFLSGANCADMLITTAGASVGEADFIRATLDELGEVTFWKMAMKPGRPLAFGRVGDTPFFGLPGNPVSVMVTFYQFVRPALTAMSGETDQPRYRFKARVRGRLKKRPGRTEYQRGHLAQAADGSLEVSTTGDQGSGILRSMSTSDCFIVLDAAQGDVEDGEWVIVEPFAGLV